MKTGMIILFDLDGVILDTEPQYTRHWNAVGEKYLGLKDFGMTIKGQTLVQIIGQYVKNGDLARVFEEEIDRFEDNMDFEFIPGALEFMRKLKEAGIPSAIVTSSNNKKMEHIYKRYPDFRNLVDIILTSEHFTRSKPDPECFLKGMEVLGGSPEDTVIFEDSLHGLTAGRGSGAHVIGLCTTNSRQTIASLCDVVIDDFTGLTPESVRNLISSDS